MIAQRCVFISIISSTVFPHAFQHTMEQLFLLRSYLFCIPPFLLVSVNGQHCTFEKAFYIIWLDKVIKGIIQGIIHISNQWEFSDRAYLINLL